MAETLSSKQQRFAVAIARLILHADSLGYGITFGEARRSPEEAQRLADLGLGIRNSVHCDGLAIDLNLFKAGVYQPDTEAHRPLGEWWEAQGADYRWGGRFHDGNHYSFEYQGRR